MVILAISPKEKAHRRWFTEWVRTLPNSTAIFEGMYDRLNEAMKAWPLSPEARRTAATHNTHGHYTTYSLKRGAAEELGRLFAAGLVTTEAMTHVLKHKRDYASVPSTTVRYMLTKANLAVGLGIHKATERL